MGLPSPLHVFPFPPELSHPSPLSLPQTCRLIYALFLSGKSLPSIPELSLYLAHSLVFEEPLRGGPMLLLTTSTAPCTSQHLAPLGTSTWIPTLYSLCLPLRPALPDRIVT